MNQHAPRRVLLAALVFASACTTPDVACRMKADYVGHCAIAAEGSKRLRWVFNAQGRCLPNSYGCVECYGDTCTAYLRDAPPTINDVCGLARLGHELCHVMEEK